MTASKLRGLRSDFAVLDVKGGRKELYKRMKDRPVTGECPPEFRVPVIIRGYIDGVYGNDDGVSREFTVHVEKVELPKEQG